LLHRSPDNNTLWIRATEHSLETTEYQPPKVLDPGTAEEAIWKTGEVIYDEEGYMASKFKDNKRQVYFKFTRSQILYENEVKCRLDVGMKEGETSPSNFLPLLTHFDVSGNEKRDRRYKLDVNDERFRILRLYGGESICLSQFPYALVYPHCDEGDLFDYFYHHGVDGIAEVSAITLQIAKAVKVMHDKGIVHGNLSMRSVTILPIDNEDLYPERKWVVSDLSGSYRSHQSAYLGSVSADGSVQFETGLMPPEMFAKISRNEEEIYREYWRKVEELYNVKVDRTVVDPYVDAQTGSTYVLRCHYVPDGRKKVAVGALPELPYILVPARESTDLWCFGLVLFTLCSGGRPLLRTNVRSGHLLEHDIIVNWNDDAARESVYEHIADPVAQDVILQLLSSYESRNNINMESVMSHPFFIPEGKRSQSLEKLVRNRQSDCAAHKRNRMRAVNEKSKNEWLQSRTVNIHCWNFDMLKSFHFSTSEILRKLIDRENTLPSCFVLLPYKLSSKNKKAKLAPTTKKDVERAERMGVLLLSLAKACSFGVLVEEAIEKAGPQRKWDASTVIEKVTFPSDKYEDLKDEFTQIAADRIEAFRQDPLTAVHSLIERRYFDLRSFFKDSKTFLYLVDEHSGVPLVGPAYEPYPLEISESAVSKILAKVLPFMHCCAMVVRGISGSVSGVVRLIFEAAYPHVPPSWATAAAGLQHALDEDLIMRELVMLHRTLTGLNSTAKSRRSLGDDLDFLRDACAKVDVSGDFAKMQRVHCGGSSFWTTSKGVELIQEECGKYDFKQALEIQATLETKLKSQEQVIKQLQDKVDWLSFRKDLNLNFPGDSSVSTQNSTSTSHRMENLNSASFSSHSRGQGMETVAQSASVSSFSSTAKAVSPTQGQRTNAVENQSARTGGASSSRSPRNMVPTVAENSKSTNKHLSSSPRNS